MGADPGSVRPDRSGGGHPPGPLAADEPAALEVAMTKLQWPDKKEEAPSLLSSTRLRMSRPQTG